MFDRAGDPSAQRQSARAARAALRERLDDAEDEADDRFMGSQVGVRNQLKHGIRPAKLPSRPRQS